MSSGTFASLPNARFRPNGWDDLATDADVPRTDGFGPALRHVPQVDRSAGDRLVMAVLGLAAFALLATGI